MKILKLQTFLVVIFILFLLSCSSTTNKHKDIIGKNLATYTPYPTPTNDYKGTSLPDGCTPIYINYVGRHGSRNLTKNKYYEKLIAEVHHAKKLNGLTGTYAPYVKTWLNEIKASQDPNLGGLTNQGKFELKGIASRMYNNYTTLFNLASLNKPIKTQCTYVKRVINSRKSFEEELKQKVILGFNKDSIDQKAPFKKCHEPLLRFFKMCKNYTSFLDSEPEKIPYDNFLYLKETQNSFKKVLMQIFSKDFVNNKTPEEIGTLTNYIYYLCRIEACFDKNNFMKRFCLLFKNNTDAIKRLAYLADVKSFYTKGANQSNSCKSYKYSCTLLKDFLDTTQNAIINNTTSPTANLRFGHAETIMPFVSILGLYSNGGAKEIAYTDDRIWNTSKISPMATNIYWIVYKCKSDYKVKMFVNEIEKRFPIKDCKDFYCNWDVVKKHYEKQISDLGLQNCTITQWESKSICDGSSCE